MSLRRLSETNATFRFPAAGEMDKRVAFRQRVDEPSGDYGSEPTFINGFTAWAKVSQVGAATYQASVQSDSIITHYITIRYRRGVTSDFEAVLDGQVYRIRRARDLNSKRRFLLMECEELGTEVHSGDIYG